MATVGEILATKAVGSLFTIGPDAPVYDAMKMMADHRIGALVVMDGGALAGIVTERDYARKIVLEQRKSQDTPTRAIMSSPVICVGRDETSDDCIRLMGQHRLRHLPVVEAGQVVGMISIRDLLDDIVADRRFSVAELESMLRPRDPGPRDAPTGH